MQNKQYPISAVADDRYTIVTPVAGDDDSVEHVTDMLDDIAQGFLPKRTHDAIIDGSFIAQNAENAVNAQNAENSVNAQNAQNAAVAQKVAHTITVGSTVFDGSANKVAEIGVRDIAGASRVFWGTETPQSHVFADTPQVGDIYIRLF